MAELQVIDLLSEILQEILPPFIYNLIVDPIASRAAFFLFLGIAFAEGFGKKLDYDIQQGGWFEKRKKWEKNIIKRTLNVTHHWWIGWGLMIIAIELNGTLVPPDLWYFGLGLLIDDIKDIPYRYGWKEREKPPSSSLNE